MGLWSSFKSKVNDIGSSIKRGVKQAGKWAWEHREGIGKAIGAGLDIASNLGVPGANIASKVVKGVAKVGESLGEDKFSKGLKDSSFYKKDKAEKRAREQSQEQLNQASRGYSLSTRTNGSTREGRMFNATRSFR